jgi:hypothetical protein
MTIIDCSNLESATLNLESNLTLNLIKVMFAS